ncbi:TonB-dependent siderophore receptor [Methylosinus sp. 3S-1]|nr:hypothetical protein A8B73_17900 [Methylosinus sp. 3S-1]
MINLQRKNGLMSTSRSLLIFMLQAGASAPAILVLASSPQARAQSPETLPTIEVGPQRAATGKARSTDPSAQSYIREQAQSTLKLAAPIHDVPLSVQFVTRRVIEERQALTVRQAIETVSGVESSNAFPGSLSFRIRGFNDAGANLRDGFRETSNQQDVQGIDRIEVLKGPASVLYGGSVASGGVVNIVTKTPLDANFLHVDIASGSYGLVRPTFDLNRDLTGDHSLLMRLDGAIDRSHTIKQFGEQENVFLNPSILWRATEQDTLLLRGQWFNSGFSYGAYQAPLAQQTLALPLSFSYMDPNQSQSHKDAERVSLEWTHKFDSGVKLRVGMNVSDVNYSLGTDRFSRLSVAANGYTLSRSVQSGPAWVQDYDWQNELSGSFTTGPLQHDWLVGAEAYWSLNHTIGYAVAVPTLNLLSPVYDVAIGAPKLSSNTRSRVGDFAGYVQDFVTLAPQWRLLAGVRYDSITTSSLNQLSATPWSLNHAQRFSPRFGLNFEPIPDTALYFNWSNSFVPTTSTTSSGSPLPPSASQQWEVGVKQKAFDNRVQATLALYQLTRSNVPTTDPTNSLYSVASGLQRSRGVELDVAGEIAPGWNIVLSYAHTLAKVLQDNRLPVGDLLAGVPRHSGNLWTTYEFQPDSSLHGFGLGAGLRAETQREAALPNTFLLPGYVRLDASAWYRFDVGRQPFKLQVNFQNMTNRQIYDTDGAFTLRPMQPFTAIAKLSTEF